MRTQHSRALWLVVLLAACANDPAIPAPKDDLVTADKKDGGTTPDSAQPETDEPCRAVHAQSQPMRENLLFPDTQAVLSGEAVFKKFKDNCGRCHSETRGLAGIFLPTAGDLKTNLDDALMRMQTDDPSLVMPPGKLLKDRVAPDPVIDLVSLLQAWKDAGDDEFFPDPRMNAGQDSALAADDTLRQSLTNLGTCVPAPRIVGTETAAMDELDAKFAAIPDNKSLPLKLSDTDLVSLDSEVLAHHGVISFAPAYTLWADDAKKMRYVRVPRGTSIEFSPSKQDFTIPDNTRFYKTFLKEVIDGNGNVAFKKVETRIIVVRHAVEEPGTAPVVKALYGTYAWDENETDAVLERTPLHDGSPFADHVTWYVKDEPKAKAFLDDPGPDGLAGLVAVPENASLSEKLALGRDALISNELARHYAIPGSERCLECHRGGHNGSFILGFTPLQIRRRPMGEGGIIEPATDDELNQLQRLISYGLITGLKAEEIDRKVLKLEKSEGERDPRSDKELIAQGYMLGNCAHCHNPNGYATLSAPELKDLLNFYPTANGGGIFQFPLERYSPRIGRKFNDVQTRMPYITPSIFDSYDASQPFEGFADLGQRLGMAAPWRSLIYRNVMTPFAYSSPDSAIFPHMPLNTPGYDDRAAKIMAEWMLSIPAIRKNADVEEWLSKEEQPLREVATSDRNYPFALVESQYRLDQFGQNQLTPPVTSDILDPSVDSSDPAHLVPASEGAVGIPKRAHWVELDLTDSQVGDWVPRNPGWSAALVEQKPAENADEEKQADQAILVPILQKVHADDALKNFALTPRPLGLWRDTPGCDFSSQKTVSQLSRDTYPGDAEWIRKADPKAHVYNQAPGEAIFTMICSNCHGRQADSRGRQADSLLLLTGGGTRVANFRAGLFGPETAPGANIMKQFSPAANDTTSARDWAMRYMAWMALGGTTRIIPTAILNVVGNSSVVGVGINRGGAVSANMLSVARSVCGSFLPQDLTRDTQFDNPADSVSGYPNLHVTSLNGDEDLWRAVCTFDNPAPIQLMEVYKARNPSKLNVIRLVSRDRYPAGAPVMDHRGKNRSSLDQSNLEPWCVSQIKSTEPADDGAAYLAQANIAKCPESVAKAQPWTDEDIHAWTLRGAVNAGRVVFQYLEEMTQGRVTPQPDYTQCEQLTAATK
jgi:mono/diheme cytochrome c family protein